MGFNTTLVVMNDALADIRDDPEFGKKVYDAVLQLGADSSGMHTVDIRARNHLNAATAIESHHADGLAIVAIGGNFGWPVGFAVLPLDPPKAGDGRTAAFREFVIRELAHGIPGLVISKRKPRKPRG